MNKVLSLMGTVAGIAIPLLFSFETVRIPMETWVPIAKYLTALIPFGVIVWHIFRLAEKQERDRRSLQKFGELFSKCVKIPDEKLAKEFTLEMLNIHKLLSDPVSDRAAEEFKQTIFNRVFVDKSKR
jgi:hypothetical protein